MNGSGEPAQYVLVTKWVIEGLLLPAVGSVGVVGKFTLNPSYTKTNTNEKTKTMTMTVCVGHQVGN